MQQLWLIPSLPLVGFLLLVLGHGRCNRSVARLIGVGSVAMAALVTFWVALDFYSPGAPQAIKCNCGLGLARANLRSVLGST